MLIFLYYWTFLISFQSLFAVRILKTERKDKQSFNKQIIFLWGKPMIDITQSKLFYLSSLYLGRIFS